tara:strand:+ start:1845 stop:2429 length:585 start_codon:yes stop_codon:yes gene_type:complete
MKQISPLHSVNRKGKYGNFENQIEDDLIKISEISNILIFQVVRLKNSNFNIDKIKIDDLPLPKNLKTSSNLDTSILWVGPNNWLVTSTKLNLFEDERKKFDEENFAITELSHSRAIIEMEGNFVEETLKKGCPVDINNLKKGDCINSVYNGISVTIDFVEDNPKKVRIFGARSFGESLYYSITDAALEFGYLIK